MLKNYLWISLYFSFIIPLLFVSTAYGMELETWGSNAQQKKVDASWKVNPPAHKIGKLDLSKHANIKTWAQQHSQHQHKKYLQLRSASVTELNRCPADHHWPERKKLIAKAIKDGIGPNIQYDGITPLSDAILRNDSDFAKLLLDHRADPNAECNYVGSKAPIIYWVRSSNIAQLLIQHGAKVPKDIIARNIHLFDNCPKQILFYATRGADVNAEAHGETPLLYSAKQAYYSDQTQTALSLLKCGALLAQPLSFNWHGYHYTRMTVPRFIKHQIENAKDPRGKFANFRQTLMAAAEVRKKAVAALFKTYTENKYEAVLQHIAAEPDYQDLEGESETDDVRMLPPQMNGRLRWNDLWR